MNKKTIDDSGDDDEKDAYDKLEKITNAKDSEVKSKSAQNAFYAQFFSGFVEETSSKVGAAVLAAIALALLIKFGPIVIGLIFV